MLMSGWRYLITLLPVQGGCASIGMLCLTCQVSRCRCRHALSGNSLSAVEHHRSNGGSNINRHRPMLGNFLTAIKHHRCFGGSNISLRWDSSRCIDMRFFDGVWLDLLCRCLTRGWWLGIEGIQLALSCCRSLFRNGCKTDRLLPFPTGALFIGLEPLGASSLSSLLLFSASG